MPRIIFTLLISLLVACSKTEPNDEDFVRPDVKITTQEELQKRIEEERAKTKALVEKQKNSQSQDTAPTN